MKNPIPLRRSIFPIQFSQKAVAKTDICSMLEAANSAPTHRKTEPWRFKVLQGSQKDSLGSFMAETYAQTASKFSAIKQQKIRDKIAQSPVVILLCMQRDPAECIPEWEEVAATAMAVQNLWLQATLLGLGGYWSSPSYCDQMHDFIPFNEGERCLGLFYLGHFEGSLPQRTPGSWEDKVVWYN